MADVQREIYIAATTAQAHLLKNILERQGITAFIANEGLQIAEGQIANWQPHRAPGPGGRERRQRGAPNRDGL
jgi:hypothetical protein